MDCYSLSIVLGVNLNYNVWTNFVSKAFKLLINQKYYKRSKAASYLDLDLEIDNGGWLKTKLYEKRDDFSFPIVNFPFLSSNIPAAPAYRVYISQLIRYSLGFISYHDFLDRRLLLTRKLLNCEMMKMQSSLRKF